MHGFHPAKTPAVTSTGPITRTLLRNIHLVCPGRNPCLRIDVLGSAWRFLHHASRCRAALSESGSGLRTQEPAGWLQACDYSADDRDLKLRLIGPQTELNPANSGSPPQNPNIRSRIINLKGLLEIFQGKSRRHAAPTSPWHAIADCQFV